MSAEAEATIRKLEEARCLALTSADYAALSDLLADDLVHVHANGLSEGKAAYLAGIAEKLEFLSVARPDLTVRVHDGVALATGPMVQTVRIKANGATVEMQAQATIVWRQDGGKWRICSFQATNVAAH